MKNKILLLLLVAVTSVFAQKSKNPVVSKKQIKSTNTVKTVISNDAVFADFETSKGKIVLQLEYTKTPVTVANFVSLIEGKNPFVSDNLKGKPFYNGLKFHRVIPDFMIQGGDPAGNGSGGAGYSFKDEIVSELKHDKGGILSMANSGPATNSSQFFITHKETPWLDGKHTVFGHVVSGMEVVNAIKQDDVIISVSIRRVGASAKNYDAVKVFSDYYATKADDDKKTAAARAEQEKMQAEARAKQALADAEAKKVYNEKYAPMMAQKATTFKTLKDAAIKTDSGLKYNLLKKGTGVKPADGATVYIHYAGYLEDGSLFDSSYEAVSKEYGKFDQNRANANGYAPFPFQFGKKDGLIPGFLEGVNLMSFGDTMMLFIPSKLGYGQNGAGNVIPPNADLIFQLEVLEKLPEAVAPKQ